MTANSNARNGPLAAVALLHFAATLWAAPAAGESETISYLAWFVLFPVQFSLIAIWLGMQASLSQRLPWAVMSAALLIAWYLLAPLPEMIVYAWMVLPMLPASVLICLAVRSSGPPPPAAPARFGIRHMLLWIAAAAVTLAVARLTRPNQLAAIEELQTFGPDMLWLCDWIAVEYCVAVPFLVAMIRADRFLRWFPWFAICYFPATLVTDAAVSSSLMRMPFYLDLEGLVYSALQIALLAVSLWAWRHSGRLPTRSRKESADSA